MNQKYQYRAPWDILMSIITIAVIVLLVGLNIITGSISGTPTVIAIAAVLGCAAFGVFGYSIQDRKIKVLRLGWSKDISISDIQSVNFVPNAMMGSIRTFGNGGVFGYIGHFRNGILGNYQAYVTHRRKTVVIRTTENKHIVISPDDPEQFVSTLNKYLTSADLSNQTINNEEN